jgi:glutathione S-transferase
LPEKNMHAVAQLYHYPTGCSGVTQIALEVTEIPYELVLVDLAAGAHRKHPYLTLNPRAKVPALFLDGRTLTENAAILFELNTRSDDRLLGSPKREAREQFVSDLVWCAATLHPIVRQIRAPLRFTDGDPEAVRAHGIKQFATVALMLETRLMRDWWYGRDWSIVDTYLRWIVGVAETGFDFDRFPAIRAHCKRIDARPESERAAAREARAIIEGHWLK